MTGPARVLMQDPCPLGLPEMLTVDHMSLLSAGNSLAVPYFRFSYKPPQEPSELLTKAFGCRWSSLSPETSNTNAPKPQS